jgi:flagellar motor switch protein FliG
MARSAPALSGARKAAILLTVLGEEAAALIYRQLPQTDIQAITTEVASLDSVPPELAQQILEEYQQQAPAHRFVIQGGADYASRLLKKAFGDENAKDLVQKVAKTEKVGNLQWLRTIDPQKLAAFLEKEHPQTTALVLAHLAPQNASSILAKLPDEVRIAVVKRMAQIRQFSPEIAETIGNVLQQKLGQAKEEKKQVSVRPENVSELMNHLEPATCRTILEAIEKENSELANDIRNLMFTFEDLVNIPENALRDWLAAVDKKTLGLALKGASEGVRDHIFKAMSSRAVEMMKEDIEALGRVRSKEVTKAQQEAVAIARTLEAEGKITLRAEKDDDFVA